MIRFFIICKQFNLWEETIKHIQNPLSPQPWRKIPRYQIYHIIPKKGQLTKRIRKTIVIQRHIKKEKRKRLPTKGRKKNLQITKVFIPFLIWGANKAKGKFTYKKIKQKEISTECNVFYSILKWLSPMYKVQVKK